jgi:hypothetical protein
LFISYVNYAFQLMDEKMLEKKMRWGLGER